jgi:hypothetical protein
LEKNRHGLIFISPNAEVYVLASARVKAAAVRTERNDANSGFSSEKINVPKNESCVLDKDTKETEEKIKQI